MCTLIILRDVCREWPLVIAANRDEFYSRPTAPPTLLHDDPPIFAGRDLLAGGTWMGVSASGVISALTNQPTDDPLRRAARSRGELITALLQAPDPDAAEEWLRGQPIGEYNPFNLIFGTSDRLRLVYGRSHLEWGEVPSGVSVLTNGRLDSPDFPKVERIKGLCRQLDVRGPSVFDSLQAILRDDEIPDDVPYLTAGPWPREVQRRLHAICVSSPAYGTRSATIVALDRGRVGRYLHAEGAPGDTEFRDLTPAMLAAFGGEQ